MGKKEGTRNSDIRRAMLAAAADIFRSADYDVFAGVANQNVAERAGVSRRTVQSYFHRQELHEELVPFLLGEPIEGVSYGSDQRSIRDMTIVLCDRCGDSLLTVGAEMVALLSQSYESVRTRLALWPYARGNDAIGASLLARHREREDRGAAALSEVLAESSSTATLRPDWITPREFATACIALLDGLAVRADLAEGSGPSPELANRIIAAVLHSMIVFDGDGGG